MFSLTTLPVHYCSTVFTDVTSLTQSPTLVTLLVKRTYTRISEYYCGYVSLQCYETDTRVVKSTTSAVQQHNVLAKSLDKPTI